MSYQVCAEHKPTRWHEVGSIPAGWEARRLKFVATCNDETLHEGTDPDFEIAYVDISSVDLINGITAMDMLTFEQAPSRARRVVKDGDTLISSVRTYLKAIAPVNEPPVNMIVSTGFAVVRPLSFIDSGFLGYALQNAGFIDAVVANSTGVSYPAINPTALICLRIAYPTDKKEQQKIAAFLDWKTGQIDALIAKKKELMGKLKEKRQAVITQAVTKGLDTSAPMRDSGVPWLGQVPVHWEVKPLRRVVSNMEQGWSPECENIAASVEDWGVVKAGCCNGGVFDPEENKTLPFDLLPPKNLEICAGDLLMSRANGSEDFIGSVALVPANTRPKLILSDKIYRLRYEGNVLPEFLAHTLQSPLTRFQILAAISGASGLARNIAQSDVKNFLLPMPPLDEQRSIANHLNIALEKLMAMQLKIESAITHLTEYRTALITAATTGKIDIRQVAIPAIT